MIIVECDPDKFVVRRIIPRRRIKHGGGKAGVLKTLEEEQRAVGIVDEDPDAKDPGEVKKKYIERDTRDTIKLFGRKDGKAKSLIQLSPDIEGWLIDRAKENGIRLRDYGLPDDQKKMHDIPHIEDNPSFQRLIKRLIRTHDDEINTFRRWVREAIE